ncbi:MAG: hypothetical protein QM831_06060 [Kofleriaceae bacterium]
MICIVQCHLEGGTDYKHIVRVRWRRTGSTAPYDRETSVEEVVGSLLAGEKVWSDPQRAFVPVASVHVGRAGKQAFLESRADTSTTANNLLALQRF